MLSGFGGTVAHNPDRNRSWRDDQASHDAAGLARLRAHGADLVGEVERYEDIYRLCYVRGPEGIIVELAEQIG
jgi:catechol 2,3-dioxygenase-like lactoylglutathione lyase family enzyme